jgi:hypothetical protein
MTTSGLRAVAAAAIRALESRLIGGIYENNRGTRFSQALVCTAAKVR